MKTVTIEVSGIETTKKRMKVAFRGKPQGGFISFVSFELTRSSPKACVLDAHLPHVDVDVPRLGRAKSRHTVRQASNVFHQCELPEIGSGRGIGRCLPNQVRVGPDDAERSGRFAVALSYCYLALYRPRSTRSN